MSYLPDKRYFKTDFLNKPVHLNTEKSVGVFANKNVEAETSFASNASLTTEFTEILSCESSTNPQVNKLFKVPNCNSIPVKKATIKPVKSPRNRVQMGRVKNDLKSRQQAKMSLIPRPSFINSRKSLHCSRTMQSNARKELIKKMVFLAECALKENEKVKPSTPVKVLAGLTPKKTPRSGGYFILPEFKKTMPKLEDIRSPLQDFIKKEMYGYSAKRTPLSERKNGNNIIRPNKEDIKKLALRTKEELNTELENDENERFNNILHHCKIYAEEVSSIHNKLKKLDDSLEIKLKSAPDYKVYNEFCFYQTKKEELYREIQAVEADFRNVVSNKTDIGKKLKDYMKKKKELFEQQTNLHENFERAVHSARETNKPDHVEEENPKLRRSVRLSKIKTNKVEERTPLSKKLKKLDSKSKGILKNGRV